MTRSAPPRLGVLRLQQLEQRLRLDLGREPQPLLLLINQSFLDLIKIGRTLRDSRARARALSTTGVAMPFQLAFEFFSAPVADRQGEWRARQALSSWVGVQPQAPSLCRSQLAL
jgi:hypothetical protein